MCLAGTWQRCKGSLNRREGTVLHKDGSLMAGGLKERGIQVLFLSSVHNYTSARNWLRLIWVQVMSSMRERCYRFPSEHWTRPFLHHHKISWWWCDRKEFYTALIEHAMSSEQEVQGRRHIRELGHCRDMVESSSTIWAAQGRSHVQDIAINSGKGSWDHGEHLCKVASHSSQLWRITNVSYLQFFSLYLSKHLCMYTITSYWLP
jgi:hypothetical protein